MNAGPDELDRSTVLVIEDDAVLRRGLKRLLKREYFRTLGASSGKEARAVVAEHGSPDLIICDYRLPIQNGLEVIGTLKGLGISSPFILISAYFTDDLRRVADASGAFSVLEKPLDLDVLLNECRKAVQG